MESIDLIHHLEVVIEPDSVILLQHIVIQFVQNSNFLSNMFFKSISTYTHIARCRLKLLIRNNTYNHDGCLFNSVNELNVNFNLYFNKVNKL